MASQVLHSSHLLNCIKMGHSNRCSELAQKGDLTTTISCSAGKVRIFLWSQTTGQQNCCRCGVEILRCRAAGAKHQANKGGGNRIQEGRVKTQGEETSKIKRKAQKIKQGERSGKQAKNKTTKKKNSLNSSHEGK